MNKKEKEIVELYREYSTIKEQAKELSNKEKELKNLLTVLIPSGKDVAGVQHTEQRRVSVSYKKAVDTFAESLSKKQKEKLDGIIDEYTTESISHVIKGNI